jgi:diguanylate cyclase (GGDEF)-like protein/PAS domain S-box-containing protein
MGLFHATSRPEFTEAFFASRERPERTVCARVVLLDANRGNRTVDATFSNWVAEPSVAGVVVNLRDVTELARFEAAHQLADGRFELTFEHASIGMAVIDTSLRVIRTNQALLTLLGRRSEEVLGGAFSGVVHPHERELTGAELAQVARGEVREYHASRRLIRSNGQVAWVDLDGVLVCDAAGAPTHVIVHVQDTTDRRLSEDALAHQSLHDALTGLPNRTLLDDRLNGAIGRAGGVSGEVAVLYVDIDRFQGVNDGLGHGAGDDLLLQVAGRLAAGLRRADTLARFGSDEFVIVREGCDAAAAAALGDAVVRQFDRPYRIGDEEVRVTASVGVVLVDERSSGSDALRDADVAATRAKRRGGGRSEQFEAEARQRAAQRFGLEQLLSRAIDRRELRVVYQPILEIATDRLAGFEALLRWHTPKHGELAPGEIIEIAESTGQIARIGELVLADALDRVVEARRVVGPGADLWVSVNLSSREFVITDPVARCAEMLAARAVTADAVRYELTETAVMEDVEASIAQLRRLQALGVKVALDDFGTGHSSLAYLARLPVSVLKIDHSFISSLSETPRDLAIIEGIVSMGKTLGLELCAEGIETPQQFEVVSRLGCDHGQGYFFARPLEADELSAYVAAGVAFGPSVEGGSVPA